jgi:hypothetical protein
LSLGFQAHPVKADKQETQEIVWQARKWSGFPTCVSYITGMFHFDTQ